MNDVKFTPEKDGDGATGSGELTPTNAQKQPVVATTSSGPNKLAVLPNASFNVNKVQESIKVPPETRKVITLNTISSQSPEKLKLTTPSHTPFEVNTVQGPLEMPPTPQGYLRYVHSLGPRIGEVLKTVKETEKFIDLSEEVNIYDRTKVNKATQCLRFPKEIERGKYYNYIMYYYVMYYTYNCILHFTPLLLCINGGFLIIFR